MWITLWKLGISFANIVVIKRKKGFSTFSQSDRKRVKKLGWSTAETGDLWTKKDAYPQLKACVYPRRGYPQRGFLFLERHFKNWLFFAFAWGRSLKEIRRIPSMWKRARLPDGAQRRRGRDCRAGAEQCGRNRKDHFLYSKRKKYAIM